MAPSHILSLMANLHTDAQHLMRELGVDPNNIDLRLQLVGLSPDDSRLIRQLKPLMDREVNGLVNCFFDFLATRPEASKLLEDQPLCDMARALKREHLLAMVKGVYDERYVGQRLRLAQVYSSAELPQRIFMGAIEHLLRSVGDRIIEQEASVDGFRMMQAFRKVASFDIALIVDTLIHEREKVIRSQEESIRQLSTPILQLRKRMLLLPLIGSVDRARAKQLTDALLTGIRSTRAQVAVIDLTGTAFLDSAVADHLRGTIRAARVMGCKVIISGISAQVAEALVNHQIILEGIEVVGDLRRGIEAAEQLIDSVRSHVEILTDNEISDSAA